MYIVLVRIYIREKSATQVDRLDQDCSLSQNGKRKYDGETSEGVSCSFVNSSFAVRSRLAVQTVAPRVPDS